MTSAAHILRRAALIIEQPAAWTTETHARSRTGADAIYTTDPYGNKPPHILTRTADTHNRPAVAWCALGALDEARYQAGAPLAALAAAETALQTILCGDIARWNDKYAETGQQVAKQMRAAADLAEQFHPDDYQ